MYGSYNELRRTMKKILVIYIYYESMKYSHIIQNVPCCFIVENLSYIW